MWAVSVNWPTGSSGREILPFRLGSSRSYHEDISSTSAESYVMPIDPNVHGIPVRVPSSSIHWCLGSFDQNSFSPARFGILSSSMGPRIPSSV